MNIKEKWVLWLKATTITVIFILLLLEVLIVVNEALNIMNGQRWNVCCTGEAIVLARGSQKIQLGPSVKGLESFTEFVVQNLVGLVPPFSLIRLAKEIINFF